jgi:iron(III) transport system ATP-binding protein
LAPALELTGVTHRFGSLKALSDLALSVEPGQVVCLLGPSGCGKSTALRIAAGLEALQEGEVSIAGNVVADRDHQMAPESRNIGLVFQDYALFPHLSVLDNVLFGLGRLPRGERRGRALEMLERVHMRSYAEAFPHVLSGGQQQRVALARALAPGPRVMLLDEPYSGLDARLRDQVRDEVLHLLKVTGCATLMVTHDSEEAMFMADRIVVMRDGRVVQAGTPAELYCSPCNAFVAGFFSELNHIDGVIRDGMAVTEVGSIAAAGYREGERVAVVIRPEALKLGPPKGARERRFATVVEARLLGRTSLVHLSFPWPVPDDGHRLHLHARVPGVMLPDPGQVVSVDLDLSQTFVFPDTETAG